MDDAACEQAVTEHLDRVYSYAAWVLRDLHEAHDVAQEACMRLWRDRHKVDRPGARAWLLTVASRICIDRARKRKPVAAPHGVLASALAGDQPDQALLDAEQRRDLARAFGELSVRDRAVLTLAEVQGVAHDDIGRILNMRPGAVRVAAHRARTRLLDLLQPAEATS